MIRQEVVSILDTVSRTRYGYLYISCRSYLETNFTIISNAAPKSASSYNTVSKVNLYICGSNDSALIQSPSQSQLSNSSTV